MTQVTIEYSEVLECIKIRVGKATMFVDAVRIESYHNMDSDIFAMYHGECVGMIEDVKQEDITILPKNIKGERVVDEERNTGTYTIAK